MPRVRALAEIEREQRQALLSNRDALWKVAQTGFIEHGRGLVVADGTVPGDPTRVKVSWRRASTLLDANRDAQPWVRASAEQVRTYDPTREFVVQYLSPRQQVHVYRLSA